MIIMLCMIFFCYGLYIWYNTIIQRCDELKKKVLPFFFVQLARAEVLKWMISSPFNQSFGSAQRFFFNMVRPYLLSNKMNHQKRKREKKSEKKISSSPWKLSIQLFFYIMKFYLTQWKFLIDLFFLGKYPVRKSYTYNYFNPIQ